MSPQLSLTAQFSHPSYDCCEQQSLVKKRDFMGARRGDLVILKNIFDATSPYLKSDFMICTQTFGPVLAVIKPK